MRFEVCIALGSNLGNREQHIAFAFSRLRELAWPWGDHDAFRCSTILETEPMGPEQPHYLNACVRITTQLQPALLMHMLLSLENQRGRVRNQRWGPRTLDLDIIRVRYAGTDVAWTCDLPCLTVPHPEYRNRIFVLAPLLEVDDDPELVARLEELRDHAN